MLSKGIYGKLASQCSPPKCTLTNRKEPAKKTVPGKGTVFYVNKFF